MKEKREIALSEDKGMAVSISWSSCRYAPRQRHLQSGCRLKGRLKPLNGSWRKLPAADDFFNRICQTQASAEINCRDVPSLAGPEPDRQVFAKFKHLLR
jgi:hypothetical protein